MSKTVTAEDGRGPVMAGTNTTVSLQVFFGNSCVGQLLDFEGNPNSCGWVTGTENEIGLAKVIGGPFLAGLLSINDSSLDPPTFTLPKFSDGGVIFSNSGTAVGVDVGVVVAVEVAVTVAVAVSVGVGVALDVAVAVAAAVLVAVAVAFTVAVAVGVADPVAVAVAVAVLVAVAVGVTVLVAVGVAVAVTVAVALGVADPVDVALAVGVADPVAVAVAVAVLVAVAVGDTLLVAVAVGVAVLVAVAVGVADAVAVAVAVAVRVAVAVAVAVGVGVAPIGTFKDTVSSAKSAQSPVQLVAGEAGIMLKTVLVMLGPVLSRTPMKVASPLRSLVIVNVPREVPPLNAWICAVN